MKYESSFRTCRPGVPFRMFRRSRKSSAETPQKSNRIFWNIFVNGQKPLKQIFMKSPPLSVLIYLHLPKQPIKLLPPHPFPISHLGKCRNWRILIYIYIYIILSKNKVLREWGCSWMFRLLGQTVFKRATFFLSGNYDCRLVKKVIKPA